MVGKSVSPKAMILSRQSPEKPWHLVDENEGIFAGDLLIGLPGAKLISENGSVTVTFMSDLDGTSPFPVIESAFRLQGDSRTVVDFTLDRGRVHLVNSKREGTASIRIHFRTEVWEAVLTQPGDGIALETYGYGPCGTRFTKKSASKDVPTSELIILITKGELLLKHKGVQMAMSSPPGDALIEWDNVTGQDNAPSELKELPAWAKTGQEASPTAKAKAEALERFRQRLLKLPITEAIEGLLNSNDPIDRRVGIYAAGALDHLDILGKSLRDTKHPDLWGNTIIALRHWIGRAPGQDQALYAGLLEKELFNPVTAETVIQLLHSFSDDDLTRPEVYDALVAYLRHENLAIRNLAYWHLSRLVPQGRKFGYDPAAAKEDREKAILEWKKLIPGGKLPPKEKVIASK
jgi:hypothetical protein